MKLILAFKMKAIKGLFESFYFLFSTAYFKRYTILLTTYKSRKIKCYNYLLSFFIHLCKGYYHNYVSYHRIHRYILLSWGIPYKRVYQGGRKLTRSNRGQCNPWTKSLGPLDLGLVQVGLHWCNPWTSYLLDQTYTGTLGN